MPDTVHRIALFGAGRIGSLHAANLYHHPNTELAAVIDPDSEAAERVARRYGGLCSQAEDVWRDSSITAVFICSATSTHAPLIEAAAQAGKHIFCEKPIDLDYARAYQCLERVRAAQVHMVVGFNRRFDPTFRAMQQRIAAGDIGKACLLQITSRDPAPPPLAYLEHSGGLFKDMMIHDLDMACFLLAELPHRLSAQGSCLFDPAIAQLGDVDTAAVTLEFPSGALALISNSRYSSYGYDQRIEVHGLQGMLQAENMLEHNLRHSNAKGSHQARVLHFFLERYQAAYRDELEHFVAVLNGQSQPNPDGQAGVQALYLAEAASRAQQTGQPQKLEFPI